MVESSPEEIAKNIILKHAEGIDANEALMLRDDIAQAIKNEQDLFSSHVQILTVQPGDVVFFETNQRFSDLAYARLIDGIQKVLPCQKIVILEDVTIKGVLHPKAGNNAG